MTGVLIDMGAILIICALVPLPDVLSAQWWCLVIGVAILSAVAGRLVDAVAKK